MPWSRSSICKTMSKCLRVPLTWNWLSMGGSDVAELWAGMQGGDLGQVYKEWCVPSQGGCQDDEHSRSALAQTPCGTLGTCRPS